MTGHLLRDRVRELLALALGRSVAVEEGGEVALLTPSDVLVVADVVGLCRVAAARLRPEHLDATIEGDRDLADLVLAHVDAFARD